MTNLKFATNLTLGILGQPDSDQLWSEIVSRVPDSVLLDPNTKILNVAFGECTEAVVLVNRMIALGLTPNEALNKLYLLDKFNIFTNYAKQLGFKNVIQADFLTWETDMKFDVVIGNPPYQDTSANKKGNLWSKFIDQCDDILEDNGYMCFITPKSWMAGTDSNGNQKKKRIHSFFNQNNFIYLDLDAAKHFSVGSTFSAWIVQKNKDVSNLTIVKSNEEIFEIDLKGFVTLPSNLNKTNYSILSKVLNYKDKSPFTASGCIGYPKPLDTEEFKVHNTGSSMASSKVEPANAKTKKVVVSVPGYLKAEFDDGIYGCSINSYWTPVSGEEEADLYINAINSKLFQKVFNDCKYSGFNNTLILKMFPKITTTDLYKQFGLTEEEIKYIEQ